MKDFAVKPLIAASALFVPLAFVMAGTSGATAATIVFLPPAQYQAVVVGAEGGDQIENNRDTSTGATYPLDRPFTATSSGTINAGGTNYTASATLSLSNAHGGSVSATATTQTFSAGASGGILYYFNVIGPDAAYVPVLVSGHGEAMADSASGFASSYAEMRLNYLDGRSASRVSRLDTFNNGDNHDFSELIDVKPNAIRQTDAPSISLFARANVGTNQTPYGYYDGTASASIDPIISIADPKLAALYTIEIGLSDVVLVPPTSSGPTSPVPLPRSLPSFAMALLVIGGAGWLRRRAACA